MVMCRWPTAGGKGWRRCNRDRCVSGSHQCWLGLGNRGQIARDWVLGVRVWLCVAAVGGWWEPEDESGGRSGERRLVLFGNKPET